MKVEVFSSMRQSSEPGQAVSTLSEVKTVATVLAIRANVLAGLSWAAAPQRKSKSDKTGCH